MTRLRRMGYTVDVDLKDYGYDGYSVECTYKYMKKSEKYLLRMGLKPKNSENRIKVELQEIDTQYISGTSETIEDHILRIIEQAACHHKFFDQYIERYEYECKCFDIGNIILENVLRTQKERH